MKLEIHYRKTLETLGKQGGMLGIIFRKSRVCAPPMRCIYDMVHWRGARERARSHAQYAGTGW